MYKITLSSLATTLLAGAALSQSALADDYQITVTNLTRGVHFTPVIAAAHDPAVRMFHAGTEASSELQAIAEGGDVSAMQMLLDSVGASVATGDGLVAPGQSVTLDLHNVSAASVISLTGMLLPTNDGFVGIDSAHLPDHAGGSVTLFARGYDAGTEANDELVGGGAPGVAGFPAPPPIVATGTGTNGTGIAASAEGFVHVHPGVLGDLDGHGGVSDINAAVHRWQNPVARVVITHQGGNTADAPSAVASLSGAVYSSTALELFWEPASSDSSNVVAYRVTRDGELLNTLDAQSYFEQGLAPGTSYTYTVSAIDANGVAGDATEIQLTTNAR